MANIKRKCVLCGQEYEYCPNCGKEKVLWKSVFCSENCKDVWDVLLASTDPGLPVEKSKQALEKLDTSRINSYGKRWKELATKLVGASGKKPVAAQKVEKTKEEKPEDDKKGLFSKTADKK